jgi:ABC-type multidrug transport system permease subunit
LKSEGWINKMIRNFFRTTWFILRKDLQIWLRQPANIAATIVPALVVLLVQALGAQAVGRSPVALVVQDTGTQGVLIAQAIRSADVFRLHEVDAAQAQTQLKNLDVVAIVTIPADFTTRLQAHQPAQVDVTINNLNLDLTNDIRRAVPDAVTQYYLTQGDASPIKVTVNESDLRQRDIQLFQYAVLPTIVLLLLISGLITGGLATAREWETYTVKELLLSPAPGSAVIAGKVLAGFVTSFFLGVLVLLVAYLLGWIYPQGIYWLTTLLIVALIALMGSSLGVTIGAAFRHVQPVIGVSMFISLYLFFLSGGISVLAFEPSWLQSIAAFVPLTYGNHALQMAVFYNSAALLGRDVLVLALFTVVMLFLGSLAINRQSRY